MPSESRFSELLPQPDSMFWKIGRLKTFQNWPFQSSDNMCNSEKMATAGFFVVGGTEEPDLVECFICSKQLDGWDPQDDPWTEHQKHQPNCPFVKLGKPNEESWTIIEMFDLVKKYLVKELTNTMEKDVVKAKEDALRFKQQIPEIYKGLKKGYKD